MTAQIINAVRLHKKESLVYLYALDSNIAVGLIRDSGPHNYSLLCVGGEGVDRITIGNELPALEMYESQLQNSLFKVVLFRTKNGFGILIRDYIYLYDKYFHLYDEIRIENDIPHDKHHRYYAPCNVVELRDDRFAVTFRYVKPSPAYYSILEIDQSKATYIIPAASMPDDIYQPFQKNTEASLVLDAIGGVNGGLIIHAIGPDHNWYKYGMEFSSLCWMGEDGGKAEKVGGIEKGFGDFSSDKKWFLLHSISQKNKLHIYNMAGEHETTLPLSKKKNLDFLDKGFIHADVFDRSLWLYNADGMVCSEFPG